MTHHKFFTMLVSSAALTFGSIGMTSLMSAGCGGNSKPAEDPSAKTEEETPKWDTSSESAEAARHPEPKPPASKPVESTQRRSDEYDKEATDVVLARAGRQAKENCGAAKDENGKAVGPWGKVTVSIDLSHHGRVKGATVPPPYDEKPAGRCIVQAFSNIVFPPWSGPDTSVQSTVELSPPGK